MSDALDVLDQVGKWKNAGKGVAIATVITTWGSSPRPVGSQLGAAGVNIVNFCDEVHAFTC